MKNNIKGFLNKLSEPKNFKKIITFVIVLFFVVFIFQIGMFVGLRKSNFQHNWDDNFNRNFGPKKDNRIMRGMPEDFPNAHGAVGKIIKIESSNIIVSDKDNIEKIVIIKDDTIIKKMRESIKPTDLKIDDFIIVIGSPNDKGQIEAKLIRIMPSPDLSMNSFYRTRFQ